MYLLAMQRFVQHKHTYVCDSAEVHEVLVIRGELEADEFEPEYLCHAGHPHNEYVYEPQQGRVGRHVAVHDCAH